MENLLEAIRAAVTADANDEMKAAGASACRMILTALEAQTGEPLAATAPVENPLVGAVAMLRGMQPEQLLDLAISRLRAALPADAQVAAPAPVKFHIVQVPPGAKR